MSALPQRIAVTGASGLIGSALVGHLKNEGHTVQRLVRRLPVSPDEVQWDPATGYVIDLKIVKDLIKNEITDRFDHKNLNLDCKEFLNLNPTAENIAVVCWNLLRTELDTKYELSIKLWETENNLVEYNGQ